MSDKAVPETAMAVNKIVETILKFVSDIPESDERKSRTPAGRASKIANAAAVKAALAAGTLALPPGPLGWITILPELIAVWKIQSQMVADLAAVYGKTSTLTREQMLYCLFRHLVAQAARDLVVRVGSRVLVREASLRIMQKVTRQIGVKITQRTTTRVLVPWVPVVGALGVAAYAFYDTGRVAATATELFDAKIELVAATADGKA